MVERRQKKRETASGYYTVFDTQTDKPLGKVVNLSEEGIMLISEWPVETSQLFHCRMALPEKVLDRRLVVFDAECKWCRMNETAGVYECGYYFQEISAKDQEVIKLLLKAWTSGESETDAGATDRWSLEA